MQDNILEKAFDLFEKVQREQDSPPPDEVSFIGGCMTLFGILTGRVDIGLDQEAPMTDHFEAIQRALEDFRGKVITGQKRAVQ